MFCSLSIFDPVCSNRDETHISVHLHILLFVHARSKYLVWFAYNFSARLVGWVKSYPKPKYLRSHIDFLKHVHSYSYTYTYSYTHTHSARAHNEDSAIALNSGDTCFFTTFKIQTFQIENDAR